MSQEKIVKKRRKGKERMTPWMVSIMDFRLHPSSKRSAQDWPLKSPKATVRKQSIDTVVILSHLEPGSIIPDALCTHTVRPCSVIVFYLLPWYNHVVEDISR